MHRGRSTWRQGRARYQRSTAPVMLRSQEEIESFFGDFELVDPGLEQIHTVAVDGPVATVSGGIYGGVGGKR